jgi:hypothetical protein
MEPDRWAGVLKHLPCATTRDALDKLWGESNRAGRDSAERWSQLRVAVEQASKGAATKANFAKAPHAVKEIMLHCE